MSDIKEKFAISLIALLWASGVWFYHLGAPRKPHREWETATIGFFDDRELEAKFRKSPMVPWARWVGQSYGNLAFMAGLPSLRVWRHEIFSVDEYGFRNLPGTFEANRDVVVAGNSFAAGSMVSDGETLDAILTSEYGIKAYNIAGYGVSEYLRDVRWKKRPARWLVYYIDEIFWGPLDLAEGPELDPPAYADHQAYREAALKEIVKGRSGQHRQYQLKDWFVGNPVQKDFRHSLENKPNNLSGVFEPALKTLLSKFGLFALPKEIYSYDRQSGMLFHKNSGEMYAYHGHRLRKMGETVDSYKEADRLLRARGTRLIVLVCPNKESVYQELIPKLKGADPDQVRRIFQERMGRENILCVDAYKVLRAHALASPEEYLFLKDDTHPTKAANQVLAGEVARIIKVNSK